jgi:Spy/CpxP family protein refolding chaperone
MKPNTLKVIAGLVLAFAITAPGLAKEDGKDPGKRHERIYAKLAEKLELTKEQQAKIDPLREKHQQTLKTLFTERAALLKDLKDLVKKKAKDSELAPKLRALDANWKAVQSENDSFADANRVILTPTQQAKVQLWLAKQAKKGLAGKWGKGHKGGHEKEGNDEGDE